MCAYSIPVVYGIGKVVEILSERVRRESKAYAAAPATAVFDTQRIRVPESGKLAVHGRTVRGTVMCGNS